MGFTIADQVREQMHARRPLPPPGKLRELRLKGGLTEAGVGRIVGVSKSAISMYESGARGGPRQGTPQRQRYLDLLEALEGLS